MVNDSPNGSTAKSEVDMAASDACTRSGAFALLLSVALILLIPYLVERREEVALSQYISFRLNLLLRFEALDRNPVWQKYKTLNEAAESTSIAQLKEVSVPITFHSEGIGVATSGPKPPAPVTNLAITTDLPINEIPQIADYLGKLNDSQLLTLSRKVSKFFDYSVVRWVTRRNSLVYGNVVVHSCTGTGFEKPQAEKQSEYFVPAILADAQLKCLTLSDVRQLAQFELPTARNPPQLGEPVGREIDVSPGSMPRDPYWASVLAQVLLFFVMMYFGAFVREAISSPTFPVPGTLFGAFSRSGWTLFVLSLTLCAPLVASLGVAFTSHEWSLALLSIPIFCATLFAYLPLQRKSYFGPMWFGAWRV